MKLTFLTIAFLISTISVFAQVPDCNAIKKELSDSKSVNEKLQQENDYLKKSLNILQPIKSVEQGGIEFKLLKSEGNIKEQTVTCTFSITNHKANEEFQFGGAQAIDIQGNDFHSGEIYIGKESLRNKLYTDTPLQTKIIFSQILPSIKILKLLSINYLPVGIFNEGAFEFKDLDIIWR